MKQPLSATSAAQLTWPSERRPAHGTTAPRIHSRDLFGNADEIEIEHGDVRYRLRKTQLGKLIMTK